MLRVKKRGCWVESGKKGCRVESVKKGAGLRVKSRGYIF